MKTKHLKKLHELAAKNSSPYTIKATIELINILDKKIQYTRAHCEEYEQDEVIERLNLYLKTIGYIANAKSLLYVVPNISIDQKEILKQGFKRAVTRFIKRFYKELCK
jgi:hypothetical protein